MSNEEWYDAEIAPALNALATRCKEHGMSFVAAVEYEPGDRAGTYLIADEMGIAMRMIYIAAMTAPNIDSFFIELSRHCKRTGADTSGSMVMRMLLCEQEQPR